MGTIKTGNDCDGQHHFYVAERIAVQYEGAVFVIVVCTSCGEFRSHKLTVSQAQSPIELSKTPDEK